MFERGRDGSTRSVTVDASQCRDAAGRAAQPLRARGRPAKGASGGLGIPVRGDAGFQEDGRDPARVPSPRPRSVSLHARRPAATASATWSAVAVTGGTKSTSTASMPRSCSRTGSTASYVEAVAEPSMSTGFATLASTGRSPETRNALIGQRRQLEPDRFAGIGGEDSEPSRIRQHGHAATARERVFRQQHRCVHELLEGFCPDHAGLVEERFDCRLRARQRGGVEPAAFAPARGASALEREDRLRPRDPSRDARELPGVTERLEVELRSRFVLSSSSKRSSRSFDETSALFPIETNAERPMPRASAASISARPSAPLWDEKADRPSCGALPAKVAFRSRCRRTAIPRQFGPIIRAPCARTSASSRSWRSAPSEPTSANPAEMTQSARTPFASASSAAPQNVLARHADQQPGPPHRIRESALDGRIAAHAGNRTRPGG